MIICRSSICTPACATGSKIIDSSTRKERSSSTIGSISSISGGSTIGSISSISRGSTKSSRSIESSSSTGSSCSTRSSDS